jgi:hypothetical protein
VLLAALWLALCHFNHHQPDLATLANNGLHFSAKCRGCKRVIYRKSGDAWRPVF